MPLISTHTLTNPATGEANLRTIISTVDNGYMWCLQTLIMNQSAAYDSVQFRMSNNLNHGYSTVSILVLYSTRMGDASFDIQGQNIIFNHCSNVGFW